jgi:hypothetical protein
VASSQPSSSKSNSSRVIAVVVEDGVPDEFVPCYNDERLYPDLVDRSNIE